jgi:hypothetical protein
MYFFQIKCCPKQRTATVLAAEAVVAAFAAYGWKPDLNHEEIWEKLLA